MFFFWEFSEIFLKEIKFHPGWNARNFKSEFISKKIFSRNFRKIPHVAKKKTGHIFWFQLGAGSAVPQLKQLV